MVFRIYDACKSGGAKTIVGRYSHIEKTSQPRAHKASRAEAVAERNEKSVMIMRYIWRVICYMNSSTYIVEGSIS